MSHLKALITKNFLISKRNIISTICEIAIPILLIYILSILRKLFKIKSHIYSNETTDSNYYYTNGTSISNILFDYDLPYRGAIFQCIYFPYIGTVGKIPDYIKNRLIVCFFIFFTVFNLSSATSQIIGQHKCPALSARDDNLWICIPNFI